MKWTDMLCLAGKNLLHTGVRAWLCLLAVCIGMTSVSTVFSIGAAAEQGIADELEQIGISGLAFYSQSSFDIADGLLEAVNGIAEVSAAMPLSILSGEVVLRSKRSAAGVLGVDASLGDIFSLEVLHGALPSEAQVQQQEKVAVIDADFAKMAYQRTNIVGKSIRLTVSDITEDFTICAVISSQSAKLSALLGSALPYIVYVPYTALKQMSVSGTPDKIAVAVDTENVSRVASQVQRILQRQTNVSFSYENLNQYMASFTKITRAVASLVRGIAVISIIVGGIGVMNTMVSSVDARMREIGIYRALGAAQHEVLLLFLSEAMMLCLAGGLCGMVFSKLLLMLITAVTGISVAGANAGLQISFASAAFCGIFFGILPAYRAAKLDPIQAMRRNS